MSFTQNRNCENAIISYFDNLREIARNIPTDAAAPEAQSLQFRAVKNGHRPFSNDLFPKGKNVRKMRNYYLPLWLKTQSLQWLHKFHFCCGEPKLGSFNDVTTGHFYCRYKREFNGR